VNLNKKALLVISRIEPAVATILFVLMSVGLSHFMVARWFIQAGDSAFMIDLVGRAASGHGLVSSTFNSAYSIFPMLELDADAYCRSSLPSLLADVSGLRWHAYLLTFPMAWLTFVPGVTALGVSIGFNIASFMGSMLLLWLFLRRQELPVLVVAAFLILLFVFKPWSSAIMGQLYFDRMFLLPGIALVLGVHSRLTGERFSFAWIVALTVVCALVSERPAVMTGCFLIAYPVLRRGLGVLKSRDCWWLVALGVGCWAYTILYVRLFQDSPYKGVASGAAVIAALKSSLVPGGAYHAHTMKLFAVLLPFFILAVFEWRLCLVAAAAVMPNLMLTIGGAEKNGFATHYHMVYLPFLIAAAALGLVRIRSLLRPWSDDRWFSPRRVVATAAMVAGLAGLAVYSDRINAADLKRTFVFDDPGDRALPTSLLVNWPNPVVDVWVGQAGFYRDFVSDIPDGSTVSSPEWFMPILAMRREMTIYYAPIALGTSQYMIMVYDPVTEGGFKLQVPSFRGEDELGKIRACIQSRVDASYNVMKQQEFRGSRYRLYVLKKAD
jgi:hypothetical protein